MIELYTWNTPNGYKVPILLEELEVPYLLHPIDIHANEQDTPAYNALNPNHKIPVLVDGETTLSESGAILIYLAEKYAAFLSRDASTRASDLQWLMFQMASVGPMFGQANHFLHYAPEKVDYGINRYTKEANRLMSVIDRRLTESPYLGGEAYSIADIATWPWIRKGITSEFISLSSYANVERWYTAIQSRPAVIAALEKIDNATNEHTAKRLEQLIQE